MKDKKNFELPRAERGRLLWELPRTGALLASLYTTFPSAITLSVPLFRRAVEYQTLKEFFHKNPQYVVERDTYFRGYRKVKLDPKGLMKLRGEYVKRLGKIGLLGLAGPFVGYGVGLGIREAAGRAGYKAKMKRLEKKAGLKKDIKKSVDYHMTYPDTIQVDFDNPSAVIPNPAMMGISYKLTIEALRKKLARLLGKINE